MNLSQADPTLAHQGNLHWATRNGRPTEGGSSYTVMVCNCGWRSSPRRPEVCTTLEYHLSAYRRHYSVSAMAS